MLTIAAEEILGLTLEQTWALDKPNEAGKLNQPIKVKFFDGDRTIRARKLIYSTYFWKFHKRFKQLKLSKTHVVPERPMDNNVDNDLLNRLAKDMLFAYGEHKYPKVNVSETIYEIISDIYQMTNTHIEEYMTFADTTQIKRICEHPKIKKVIEEAVPTRESVEYVYKIVSDVVYTCPTLSDVQIVTSVRQGNNNVKQLLELAALRGYVTEINSVIRDLPIMTSHAKGTTSPIDSLKDSRTGTKSLASNKRPLEMSEYQGRRLRLLAMHVLGINGDDCGSKHYVSIPITKDNLEYVDGCWRKGEDGKEIITWADDTHLIGKVIEIRNPVSCLNQNTCCKRCYGMLHLSVPDGTNIGWSCAMQFSEKISQGTLSLKHLAFNPIAKLLKYYLGDNESKNYAMITKDKDKRGFYLKDDGYKNYKLIIKKDEFKSVSDALTMDLDAAQVKLSDLTKLTSINLKEDGDIGDQIHVLVGTSSSPSFLTKDFIKYMRDGNTDFTDKFVVVNLKGWDINKPLINQQLKAENSLDVVGNLRWLYEGSSEQYSKNQNKLNQQGGEQMGAKVRDMKTRSEAINLFHDKISYKIPLHMSVMGVMLKAVTVVDPHAGDYHMTTAEAPFRVEGLNKKLKAASLGASFGFEDLKKWLKEPSNFMRESVDDHPMDIYLTGKNYNESH